MPHSLTKTFTFLPFDFSFSLFPSLYFFLTLFILLYGFPLTHLFAPTIMLCRLRRLFNDDGKRRCFSIFYDVHKMKTFFIPSFPTHFSYNFFLIFLVKGISFPSLNSLPIQIILFSLFYGLQDLHIEIFTMVVCGI